MRRSRTLSFLPSLFLLLATACKTDPQSSALQQAASAPKPEIVLEEGQKLIIKGARIALEVQAGPKFARTYTWADGQCQRFVELWPRTERWYGSLGLYYPGPGDHWKNCKGITRGVLEEGQMHFDSREKALAWIQERTAECRPSAEWTCETLFSNDGLFVSMNMIPSRRQLSVSVFQLDIQGKKPEALPGSSQGLSILSARG